MNYSRLNIAFLTAYSHEQGTYFRWHNLAIGFTQLGHKVEVHSIDHSDNPEKKTEIKDGVKYYYFPGSKGKKYFGTTNNPFTTIKRLFTSIPEYDVIHVFQPFLSSFLPWKYNYIRKAKITFFDWDDLWVGGLYNSGGKSIRDKYNFICTKYCEHKIPSLNRPMSTCSELLKSLAIERGNTNCTILHNGFWPYDILEKKLARKQFQLQEDSHYIGFMGRTTEELHWCFEGLSDCLKKGLNIRFALCGPEKNILDNLSPEILSNIDYLGNLTPLETRNFAAAIDIGLLPLQKNSFNESRFPIKFSEYMAANLPVICSSVGEMAHYVSQYPWVISAGSTKAEWLNVFPKAIEDLIQKRIPLIDRNIILQDLSWLGISQKLENQYLKNLASKV